MPETMDGYQQQCARSHREALIEVHLELPGADEARNNKRSALARQSVVSLPIPSPFSNRRSSRGKESNGPCRAGSATRKVSKQRKPDERGATTARIATICAANDGGVISLRRHSRVAGVHPPSLPPSPPSSDRLTPPSSPVISNMTRYMTSNMTIDEFLLRLEAAELRDGGVFF